MSEGGQEGRSSQPRTAISPSSVRCTPRPDARMAKWPTHRGNLRLRIGPSSFVELSRGAPSFLLFLPDVLALLHHPLCMFCTLCTGPMRRTRMYEKTPFMHIPPLCTSVEPCAAHDSAGPHDIFMTFMTSRGLSVPTSKFPMRARLLTFIDECTGLVVRRTCSVFGHTGIRWHRDLVSGVACPTSLSDEQSLTTRSTRGRRVGNIVTACLVRCQRCRGCFTV